MSPRRLGQHFLSDPRILARIVDALDPVPGEAVLEIGPGPGTLTKALLGRGLKVVAIEKDPRFAKALMGQNVTIVEGDALEIDWHAQLQQTFKIVGNIPYYITSPLIDKALTPPLPERVVFLVQAEVADRLAAEPGTRAYGALSVGVQALCRVEKLFTLAPGAFTPPPKVRSAVVRITPLERPLVAPDEVAAFRVFVTACFSKRRKQLKNAAPGVTEGELKALGLDPRVRPEQLAPAAFAQLRRAVRRARA